MCVAGVKFIVYYHCFQIWFTSLHRKGYDNNNENEIVTLQLTSKGGFSVKIPHSKTKDQSPVLGSCIKSLLCLAKSCPPTAGSLSGKKKPLTSKIYSNINLWNVLISRRKEEIEFPHKLRNTLKAGYLADVYLQQNTANYTAGQIIRLILKMTFGLKFF